ncbi:thiol reductant ABC exporter subunit CydC [Acidipropionibacterium virtanenii]|uniref:Putative ABC transporter ATP-binding protein n=1 Tax=Acidipropionibacterium virtanenii TaxID=2057246 RepID=A0A344UXC4_9ACTN|nr:thiol reductant ABC exporter subunit CydC [Acidipropionibacterium virtanenii]AXE39922.1 putative ABC transporter ATP-binding protein [Acidipropionibacterium virtanenii]
MNTSPWRPAARLLRTLLDDSEHGVEHGRRLLVLSVLLAACASGASVGLMGVSGWLLSRAAELPPVLYLEAAAVGVRFFGISRGVFRYAERLIGHDLALRMQGGLRMRVYDRISRTTLLGRRHGDLLVRVTADVEAILDLVVRVVVPACAASLVIIGTTVLLGRFSVGSAAVLLVSAILAGVVMPWLTQRLSRTADASMVPLRGMLADRTRELAHAAPDLVALGAEEKALASVLDVDARLRAAERRSARVRGLATGGQVVAAGVAVIGALLIGGQAVADGRMGGRILAVLVLTPLALHEVFSSFNAAAQTFTRASAALRRVDEVLQEEPVGSGDSTKAQVAGSQPSLRARDLAIGWPGGPRVLDGLDLDIGPGERVAVVGPSGIGKTTLAATVMGLIPPMGGSVETTGRVRYLAQDAHVFATTVAENVRIGARDATDGEVADALRRAGLEIPTDRVVGEDGATLSGGEAQRLALARVLVAHTPSSGGAIPSTSTAPLTSPLLILDEPTEHLDSETATALMDDLWAVTAPDALENSPDSPDSPGAAMLVITHDRTVMGRCDQVLRLG